MIGLLIAAALSGANYQTGNDLYDACQADSKQLYCYGYISGVADGISLAQRISSVPTRFCFPEGIIVRQEVDITVAYLREHPESRQQPAIAIVGVAFLRAFPCPK